MKNICSPGVTRVAHSSNGADGLKPKGSQKANTTKTSASETPERLVTNPLRSHLRTRVMVFAGARIKLSRKNPGRPNGEASRLDRADNGWHSGGMLHAAELNYDKFKRSQAPTTDGLNLRWGQVQNGPAPFRSDQPRRLLTGRLWLPWVPRSESAPGVINHVIDHLRRSGANLRDLLISKRTLLLGLGEPLLELS